MEPYELNSDATDMSPLPESSGTPIIFDPPVGFAANSTTEETLVDHLSASLKEVKSLATKYMDLYESEIIKNQELKNIIALLEARLDAFVESAQNAKNPVVTEQNKKIDLHVGQSHYRNPA